MYEVSHCYWYNQFQVTNDGKTALLSACWYLAQVSTGGDWEKFYECEPTDFNGTPEQVDLLLGGNYT